MIKNQIDFTPDCIFEYNGETLHCRIVDDNKAIRTIRGVEKMDGFIAFYKSNGEYIDSESFYEDFDDMTPMSQSIAIKYYERLLERKNH